MTPQVRHQKHCSTRRGGECDCKPRYQAAVYDKRTGKKRYKTFNTVVAAKRWKQEEEVNIRRGIAAVGGRQTVRAALQDFFSGAWSGAIRNKKGDRYKPLTLRGYEQLANSYVIPYMGSIKLCDVTRRHVQDLIEGMLQGNCSASTTRNCLVVLQVVFRRARIRGEIEINPTLDIERPSVKSRGMRIASPEEAALLLAVLPINDRPIWATALYAGLRAGELQALTWKDINLADGVINIDKSYNRKDQIVGAPKSEAGYRRVPIIPTLRDILDDLKIRRGGKGKDLVLSRPGTNIPFAYWGTCSRAIRLWTAAGLERITLHQCRHTFASLCIASGLNAKAIQVYMGHSSIEITFDLYGHLMPGNESESAELLARYIDERLRIAATETSAFTSAMTLDGVRF